MSKRLTRTQTAAETRRALLAAAARVFAREGYGGASVHQIADEAGKTTGALYAHFRGKEDLFVALLRERLSTKVSALSGIAASPSDEEKRTRLADRFEHLHEIEGDFDLLATEFWLYAARHPRARRALAAHNAELRDRVGALLGAEIRKVRRAPTVPIEDLAALVIAVGDGLGRAQRTEPDRSVSSLFPAAIEALVRGLTKPAR